MKFKCKLENLELVYKYLKKNCDGADIEIEVTHDQRLEFTSTDLNGTLIKLRIFRDSALFPKIIKEDRLVVD